MPAGRPSPYDPTYHPAIARWMAHSGLTEEQIAEQLGVNRNTVRRWKHAHPEFCSALLEGKEPIDQAVESKLLKKAMGYDYNETTREAVQQEDGSTILRVTKIVRKHQPPDHRSIVIWLSNRRPDEWRDRKEVDVSGELEAKLPPALAKLMGDGEKED